MFHNKGGRSPDSEMRRLPAISMKLVQAFAAGLRAEFADAACAPVPAYLVALVRELDGGEKPPTAISCDALLPPGNSKSAPKVHSSPPA